MIHREEFTLRTKGETEVLDLTENVRALVRKSGVMEGTVHLFVPGSTAGLTTIEMEPGCVADLRAAFERVAPRDGHYGHNARWGDGNGFSHVRAALLGPSLAVPVGGGAPLLGTWQQVVLVDFDNRGRDRKIVATVMGE
ncbi:MAG TPA: secondary thiamine-phosphate synthase enzyme YjbQ [Planctomycetota bacterium]|nr:secondary thiamine-phosphate synthase enzyme YjbQ [Planctomycetota bacterium]